MTDPEESRMSWSGLFSDFFVEWPASGDVRVFDLGLELKPGMPRHPYHPPYSFVLARLHGESNYPNGVSTAMESFSMGAHVGSHVDALGHVSIAGEGYGRLPMKERQSATAGLEVNSATDIPPLLGRGHLVDAEKLYGRQLGPADGIGEAEFERWFADHEEPGPGSVVVVRTGWMRHWPDQDKYIALKTGLPGVTRDGAEWLSSRGILAGGSDTMNFEHKPDPSVVALSVHVHFLVERGIYILECLFLDVLAAHDVTDFTFVALPLRISGGTGSPLRPVAITART
jgi:kynurenine formamidase